MARWGLAAVVAAASIVSIPRSALCGEAAGAAGDRPHEDSAAVPKDGSASNPHLAAAKRAYFDLRYDDSLDALGLAESWPGVTRADLLEIQEMRLFCLVVRKRDKEATAVARRLLALDPAHALPSKTSPRFVDFLAGVRKEASAKVALALVHDPVTKAPAFPVRLPFSIADTEHLASEIVLHHRTAGEAAWSRVRAAAKPDALELSVPAPAAFSAGGARGARVEYFLELRTAAGARLGAVGTEGAPIVLVVGDLDGTSATGARGSGTARSSSVLSRWWFWTVIGVAVAGGVVLGVLLATGGTVVDPPDTGAVHVVIERP